MWGEKKTLNERKENKNIEKTYISCAHARVHICMFHCPNRKSNIINGFRNYLFDRANDRTKMMCVHALNLIKSVTLQKYARHINAFQ